MYEVERYHRVNVDGTRLAGGVRRADTASRWSSLSSRAVYGEGRYQCRDHRPTFGRPCCAQATPAPSREDDPHHPVSVYGETKSLGESVATAVCGARVPLTVVRPQNVIGPGQALHNPYTGVLAAFLARLREGRLADGLRRRQPDPRLRARRRRGRAARPSSSRTRPDPAAPRILNAGTGVRTTLLELAAYAIEGSPRDDVARRAPRGAPRRRHRARLRRPDPARRRRAPPLPVRSTATPSLDFVRASWDRPGAAASAWDDALASSPTADSPQGRSDGPPAAAASARSSTATALGRSAPSAPRATP